MGHTGLQALTNAAVLTLAFLAAAVLAPGGSASAGLAQHAGPAPRELVTNGNFAQREGNGPRGYALQGGALHVLAGDRNRDVQVYSVALDSSQPAASVSQLVPGIDVRASRWYHLSFRGLPDEQFAVASDDDLYVRVDYLGAGGKSYDGVTKALYPQVEQARRDLAANGVRKQNGAATWLPFAFDLRIPFPEIISARITLGLAHGKAPFRSGIRTRPNFYITDLSLAPIAPPLSDTAKPAAPATDAPPAGVLLPLGDIGSSRWFYQQLAAEPTPATFDETNADRLWYHDAAWQTPFVGNLSATLRAGWKDLKGVVATADRPLDRPTTVSFQSGALVIRTANLPNHPTGRYPEPGRGNPSYITQQELTYYLPLNPKENPAHKTTDANNANGALNMGPIGIALNGVVFFNPFDMGNTDATDMMDRCCGHPQQQGMYHYHKYPVCVNSPWNDAGTGHSALLGFAFDGYPLYGPYEENGKMAKDETGEKALNAFNMHYDKARGWHYHVTPGQFPYLIGGYWGTPDSRDVRQGPPGGAMNGPPGRGGGRGGPPGGGRPPGGGPPPP